VQRDPDRLTERTFDVLVVGGGIYGLAIAYDAAQRGARVALLERDDFGCGSSFNHLRTIHGGLRYLQHLDVRRARESVVERRTLARIAPHAVVPMRFALPLYRSFTRGRLAMRAGFVIDRIVAAGRNRGVAPSLAVPGGWVFSRHHAVEHFPGLRRRGLTGAAVWYDYVAPEADRLTFSWALAAAAHGAVLVNHMEAVGIAREGRRVAGVDAVDRLTGRSLKIAAQTVVNATGGAVDRLLTSAGLSTHMPVLMAMNLVTTRDAGDVALGGRSASGRNLFLVPWRRRALFGTWESSTPSQPGAVPAEEDIAAFITELNEAFPALDLKRSDVALVHRGAVPAVAASRRVTLEGRARVRDHGTDGIDGLFSVAGAKYTTARATAEHVVDRVLRLVPGSWTPCRTASTPLPGGHVRDFALTVAKARRDYDTLVPSDTLPHLVAAYGSAYQDVMDLARTRPDWCTRLAPDSPVIGGELVWAVRHEMAETLRDAVVRRTPLGALGYPGDRAAAQAAEIVAAERGWNDERKKAELDSLRQFYAAGDARMVEGH
jgi:glycerol-3-phosphate dehydrogenase